MTNDFKIKIHQFFVVGCLVVLPVFERPRQLSQMRENAQPSDTYIIELDSNMNMIRCI